MSEHDFEINACLEHHWHLVHAPGEEGRATYGYALIFLCTWSAIATKAWWLR